MWRLRFLSVVCVALAGCGSSGLVANPQGLIAQGDASFDSSDNSKTQAAQAAEPQPALTRVALGSRADANLSSSVWNAVSATYPDLFIFAGDVVCRDIEPGAAPDTIGDFIALHDAYSDFGNLDGFLQLKDSAEVLAARYDDRLNGDGRRANANLNQIANQIHLDFWQVPEEDPRRAQTGLYYSRAYGPPDRRVQVIVLDVISLRASNPGLKAADFGSAPPGPYSLLGAAQWSWLESELQKPAEIRLIVSSTEVLSESQDADGWARFPKERARLLKLAVSAQGRTVLFSGNERHGVIYRYQTGSFFPLYELSPSSLVRAEKRRREVGPHVLFRPLMIANFGVVRIDWEERDLFLEITDDTGATFRSMRVPLAIPLTS